GARAGHQAAGDDQEEGRRRRELGEAMRQPITRVPAITRLAAPVFHVWHQRCVLATLETASGAGAAEPRVRAHEAWVGPYIINTSATRTEAGTSVQTISR